MAVRELAPEPTEWFDVSIEVEHHFRVQAKSREAADTIVLQRFPGNSGPRKADAVEIKATFCCVCGKVIEGGGQSLMGQIHGELACSFSQKHNNTPYHTLHGPLSMPSCQAAKP